MAAVLVFNVGDAAITIGVLLLLVRALLMRDGEGLEEESLRNASVSPRPGRFGRPPARRLRPAASLFGRERPDEFAVARNAPLVIRPISR